MFRSILAVLFFVCGVQAFDASGPTYAAPYPTLPPINIDSIVNANSASKTWVQDTVFHSDTALCHTCFNVQQILGLQPTGGGAAGYHIYQVSGTGNAVVLDTAPVVYTSFLDSGTASFQTGDFIIGDSTSGNNYAFWDAENKQFRVGNLARGGLSFNDQGPLQLRQEGGLNNQLRQTEFGVGNNFLAWDRIDGSFNSPTNTKAFQNFGTLLGVGYTGTGTALKHGAQLEILPTQDWTPTHWGSAFNISTIQNSDTVLHSTMYIQGTNVGINTTALHTISPDYGILTINGNVGGMTSYNSSDVTKGLIYTDNTNFQVNAIGAAKLKFDVNGATREQIDTDGTVTISNLSTGCVTSTSGKLGTTACGSGAADSAYVRQTVHDSLHSSTGNWEADFILTHSGITTSGPLYGATLQLVNGAQIGGLSLLNGVHNFGNDTTAYGIFADSAVFTNNVHAKRFWAGEFDSATVGSVNYGLASVGVDADTTAQVYISSHSNTATAAPTIQFQRSRGTKASMRNDTVGTVLASMSARIRANNTFGNINTFRVTYVDNGNTTILGTRTDFNVGVVGSSSSATPFHLRSDSSVFSNNLYAQSGTRFNGPDTLAGIADGTPGCVAIGATGALTRGSCGGGGGADSTFGALFLTASSFGTIHWRGGDSLWHDSANNRMVLSNNLYTVGSVVSNSVGSFNGGVYSGSNGINADGSWQFAGSQLIGSADGGSIQGPSTGLWIGNQGAGSEPGFTRICGSDSAGMNGACFEVDGKDNGGTGLGGNATVRLPLTADGFPSYEVIDSNYASGNPVYSYNEGGDNGTIIRSASITVQTDGAGIFSADNTGMSITGMLTVNGTNGSGNAPTCMDGFGVIHRWTSYPVTTNCP